MHVLQFVENQNANVTSSSNHLYFTSLIKKRNYTVTVTNFKAKGLPPWERYGSLFSFSVVQLIECPPFLPIWTLLKTHGCTFFVQFKTPLEKFQNWHFGHWNEHKHKCHKGKNWFLRKSLFPQDSSTAHAPISGTLLYPPENSKSYSTLHKLSILPLLCVFKELYEVLHLAAKCNSYPISECFPLFWQWNTIHNSFSINDKAKEQSSPSKVSSSTVCDSMPNESLISLS